MPIPMTQAKNPQRNTFRDKTMPAIPPPRHQSPPTMGFFLPTMSERCPVAVWAIPHVMA